MIVDIIVDVDVMVSSKLGVGVVDRPSISADVRFKLILKLQPRTKTKLKINIIISLLGDAINNI